VQQFSEGCFNKGTRKSIRINLVDAQNVQMDEFAFPPGGNDALCSGITRARLRMSHRIPSRRAQNDLERVPVLLSLTISFASETFLLRSAPITRTCSDQARPFGTGETFYIILETIGNVCPIASWASNVRLSRVNSDKIAGGN
jgi:hypothetical protein